MGSSCVKCRDVEPHSEPDLIDHSTEGLATEIIVEARIEDSEIEDSEADDQSVESFTDNGTDDIELLGPPKKASANGSDICGLESTKFIIQSGTHYIEVRGLKDEVSVSGVQPLPEVLKNGDHYLARYQRVIESYKFMGFGSSSVPVWKEIYKFYVIKGRSCIEVDHLSHYDSTGCECIFELHPECRQGDFYFANRAGFYIIHCKDNTFLHVQDMSKRGYRRSTASRHQLHKSFRNGLYYFATDDFFYVLKESAKFGMVYHRMRDLRSNEDEDVLTVSPFIVKFIQNSPLDQQGTSHAIINVLIRLYIMTVIMH